MKYSWRRLVLAAALVVSLSGAVLLSGCGASAGTVHLPAGDDSFSNGRELYEARNYSEASLSLKAYLDANPAGASSQEASYLLGMSYFHGGQYTLAQVELRHFIDSYPGSKHLDEVEFRLAQCFWEDARPPAYDQEKTTFARDQLTRFLALYPESPFVPDAKKVMAAVRDRLAEKSVINARLYLKLKQPGSTIFYADRVMSDFPETAWATEARYLKGQGLFLLGRYEEARAVWSAVLQGPSPGEWADRAREGLAGIPAKSP